MTNRPFFSIRWKIVLVYLVLLLIVFVVVSAVVTRITGNYLMQTRANEQMSEVDLLALRVAQMLEENDSEQMYELCVETCRAGGGRMLILSPTGTVLVDSHSQFNGMTILTAEIDDILNANLDRSYGYHRLEQNGQLQWVGYFASSVIYGGKRIGLVLRSISMQELALQLDNLQLTIQLSFFAVLVIIILLGFFMSDMISRPINKLKGALLSATRGDFSARAQVRGNDEISELSRTFNMMSEKIENLDQTRNRFISNASHELKTPLSAIKVLVETLLLQEDEEMDPEMVKDFLTDVNSEVDRLNSIVGDLLTLVQMDSGAVRLNLTSQLLGDLAKETLHRLKPVAEAKNISLTSSILSDCTAHIDRIRFGQVLYNLVDNAIKYSQVDGHVLLTVDHDDTDAILIVQDDGIGIPAQDLPNLFDRFYRVDKARSRATGGTGLGLSIVRETVNLHGGEIQVSSVEGKGTTFTIRLPLPEEEQA